MHKSYKEGIELLDETLVLLDMEKVKGVEIVFCPPFIHLRKASKNIEGSKYIHTGAQNCNWEESGAYTGETSCSMIKSSGASYVIIGHSERRQYFAETNEQSASLKKVNAALKHKLTPHLLLR